MNSATFALLTLLGLLFVAGDTPASPEPPSTISRIGKVLSEKSRGVIYGLSAGGDLMWYRHEGRNDGSFKWASNEGKKVGHGWSAKHVFSGGDGVIMP